MKKQFTVQCGYPAYYANTVTVEAETLDDALEKAIETANINDGWRSIDHCGKPPSPRAEPSRLMAPG